MNGMSYSPDDVEARLAVERELEPGEPLRWCSRANPARLARRGLAGSLVGIPFLAFSIFWTAGATSAGAPGFFTLWGLMFCGIGLFLIVSPLIAGAKGKSTFYAVTNRRAIIVEGSGSRTVRSWGRRELGAVSRVEHADGTGDVVFASEWHRGSKGRRYSVDIGFFGIRDARLVESLVRDLVQ